VSQSDGNESGRLRRIELLMELLRGPLAELLQVAVQIVLQSDVQDAVGVAEHEAIVVVAPALDLQDLPRQPFAPLLLQPEGEKVPERHGDEALVVKTGGQVEVDLEPSMHDRSRRGRAFSPLAHRATPTQLF
jgi:hypothetical protein